MLIGDSSIWLVSYLSQIAWRCSLLNLPGVLGSLDKNVHTVVLDKEQFPHKVLKVSLVQCHRLKLLGAKAKHLNH